MMTEVIPGSARLRGAKIIAAAAALYFVLHLLGFQKLFENDSEGIGRFCRSSAPSTASCTRLLFT